jgi:ring-1,2-phenylacetyl-CoA epoxidase subunit PaaB
VIYEVFRQERKGQPFQHAGSVTAPDEAFAEIYAREQYARRQESVALWLVRGTRSTRSTSSPTSSR